MGRGLSRNEGAGVRKISLAALFAAATAAAAWVQLPLPFSPVPITLQSLIPLLAGLFLGTKGAVAAMLTYLALGLLGVPVFAGGKAGWGVIVGPTGGFLIGMVLAAALVGATPPRATIRRQLLHLIGATLVVYAVGLPWLALQAHLTLTQALVAGALPFLPGDSLKVAAALMIARATTSLRPER